MSNHKKHAFWKNLAVVLSAILLSFAARAQQPTTSAKDKTQSPSPTAGTAAGPAAPTSSSKVVLKIGDAQITQSELESLAPVRSSTGAHGLSADVKRRMAEAFVRVIALSQQAAKDHLDASPEIRSKLEMLRAKTLGQAELEKMQSQIQITPDEIHKYYADHPLEFDTVQVRQFLVRKGKGAADAGSSGLSAEEAKATAETIRKRLAAGDSPDTIAEDFSSPNVLLIDRRPRTLRRDQFIPALQKAIFEAKEGTVPEAVDTDDAVIVVDLLKHQRVEEKEATTEIEKKLRQLKLEAQIDDLKKKVQVWMDDSYFKDAAGSEPVSKAQPPASDPK